MSPGSQSEFATFWQGDLSPYELAVFASYARRGQRLRVYSYSAEIAEERSRFEGAFANEIVTPEVMDGFLYKGRPDIRHFSDFFRLEMSRVSGEVWVDADMLLIRAPETSLPATVLCREWQNSICNSVLRISRTDDRLAHMIAECKAMTGRSLKWGETGPMLLTRTFKSELSRGEVFGPERFYPIDYGDFWKTLLPEYAEECRTASVNAWGVHLWNNIIDELGIWKQLAPPEGSFLWDCFQYDETTQLFSGIYPAKFMRASINNFRLRKSGQDLGIKGVLRQALPSVGRTLRHYRK